MLSLLYPCILASSSPRRKELLSSLGISFSVARPPEGAEPLPITGEAAQTFALRAAVAKGDAYIATGDYINSCVISADTVVAKQEVILGKPTSTQEALHFLRMLNGASHNVCSGCALFFGKKRVQFAVTTQVIFWDVPDTLLQAYAYSGEGLDKAGGYAIQGKGAFLVKSIEGSYSNVVGLPLAELVETLLDCSVAVAL